MSSTGSCWELDATPGSDAESAAPAWAAPASPLPLERLSLPLTGGVAVLLARCDILGFLLARGSMKSTAGRFCCGGKQSQELSGGITNDFSFKGETDRGWEDLAEKRPAQC